MRIILIFSSMLFLGLAGSAASQVQEHDQFLSEFVAENSRPHTGVCRGFGLTAIQVAIHQISIDPSLVEELELSTEQVDAIRELHTEFTHVQDEDVSRLLAKLSESQKERLLMICLPIDGLVVLENASLSSALQISDKTRGEIRNIRQEMGRVSIGPLLQGGFVSSSQDQSDMEIAWTVSLSTLFGLRAIAKMSREEKASLATLIRRLGKNEKLLKCRVGLFEKFYRPRIGLIYAIE